MRAEIGQFQILKELLPFPDSPPVPRTLGPILKKIHRRLNKKSATVKARVEAWKGIVGWWQFTLVNEANSILEIRKSPRQPTNLIEITHRAINPHLFVSLRYQVLPGGALDPSRPIEMLYRVALPSRGVVEWLAIIAQVGEGNLGVVATERKVVTLGPGASIISKK